MITEEGTIDDFKKTVLEDLWVWTMPCGHQVVSSHSYRDEYKRYQTGELPCPTCGKYNHGPHVIGHQAAERVMRQFDDANRDRHIRRF